MLENNNELPKNLNPEKLSKEEKLNSLRNSTETNFFVYEETWKVFNWLDEKTTTYITNSLNITFERELSKKWFDFVSLEKKFWLAETSTKENLV